MASKHVGKGSERKGWFEKGDKNINKPIPNYVSSCKKGKRGYLGPRFEAHHIIPQTTIEESIRDSSKDSTEKREYIRAVQYITEWNINHHDNMIGLPHYHAYDLYYQGRDKLSIEIGEEQEKKLVAWFNKFKDKSRKKWLSQINKISPEGYPIHNPVDWGHVQYNEEIKQGIKENIWDQINEQQKKHELDAKNVAGELNDYAKSICDYLKRRGADTNKEKWDSRKNRNDNDWYIPFTMTDVPNPIF